jgi:O-antigen/teichoic acid export membrane protein
MTPASVGVARGILRNAAALFLVGTFAKGAGLIIAVLVARFLGADAMGLFAVLFSIAVLIETFISLGMSDSLVRDVAGRPEIAPALYREALKLVAWISVIPVAGLAIAAILVDAYASARASLVILAFGTPISGAFVVTQGVLQGMERVLLLTWVSFFARIVSLVALFYAILGGAGIEAAFASRVLFHLLSLAVLSFVLLRNRAPHPAAQSASRLLTRAVPFAVNKAIRELGLRLPSFVLPGSVGLAGAGVFDSANRIRSTISMTMSASVVGLMPALARSAARPEEHSEALIGYSVKYMCLGMALVATVVALLSDWIIRLLFGTEFAAATLPLQILTWTQVLNGVDAVLQQTMLARRAVMPAVRSSTLGVVAQLVLLILLTPTLGLPGAALAVALSSAMAMAIDLGYVFRRVTSISLRHFAVGPLIAAFAVAGALLAADKASFAMRALVAVGTWAAAVAIFRVVPRKELDFLLQLVAIRRVRDAGRS